MEVLTAYDAERVKELRARDEYFWLDVDDPSEDLVHELAEQLHLNRLAVEDTIEFGQRAKLDDYDDHVLLVFYGLNAKLGADSEPVEVHLYVSGHFVITVHRSHCPHLLEARRLFTDGRAPRSEEYLVYKILDALTDSFFPVLEAMDEEIDRIEEQMLTRTTDEHRNRILQLRHVLVDLRRVVTPQRDLLQTGGDFISDVPGLEGDRATHLFRDIYDHLIRISDMIDSYRDLLSGALDLHLSVQSNRMNIVMERLTKVATVFLPLTFLTGFFGQNFGWMVDHIDSAGAFIGLGVCGNALAIAAVAVWLRRADDVE